MGRAPRWDAICTLNGTDLYGLLDKILEDPSFIDKIKKAKTIFNDDPKTVGKDTVAPGSDVAILADELEKQKHLIAWRFFHKTSHIMEINPMWCGNWKDARSLAVEAFKVAGYDPSKYNFDVKAKTDDGFRVVVTVNDGK